MKTTTDIIVIGAGIAGVSAAAELAANAKVLVLEMEAQPGYHATGRSAAYFAPAYGNQVVRGITAAGEHFYRTPPLGFTEVELVNQRDALFIANHGQVDQVVAMQQENPVLAAVSPDYVRQRVPVIKREYVAAALHDTSGGDLDVDAILQGYVRLLRQRGGSLQAGQAVKSMAFSGGVWQLHTDNETMSAPIVINAAGAWVDEIAKCAGLGALGIVPKRRTAILIDPPQDLDIFAWPLVIDIDERFYFKPDAGQILISPADETPDQPGDARPGELDIAIAADRFETVTGISVARIKHSWAGLRTFARDKTFVAGFDPRADGFFWLAGQGGYGVQSAPGLAQLTAALINGKSLEGPFARVLDYAGAVSPERFV